MPHNSLQHPVFTRRTMIQAGAIGLMGLGMDHVAALRAAASDKASKPRSVIYIFLSGGLAQHDRFDPKAYGAYPQYEFDHQQRPQPAGKHKIFQAPNLSLPEGLNGGRLDNRLSLLRCLDAQRRQLDQQASCANFDHYRQGAISLLT